MARARSLLERQPSPLLLGRDAKSAKSKTAMNSETETSKNQYLQKTSKNPREGGASPPSMIYLFSSPAFPGASSCQPDKPKSESERDTEDLWLSLCGVAWGRLVNEATSGRPWCGSLIGHVNCTRRPSGNSRLLQTRSSFKAFLKLQKKWRLLCFKAPKRHLHRRWIHSCYLVVFVSPPLGGATLGLALLGTSGHRSQGLPPTKEFDPTMSKKNTPRP